MLCSLVSNLSIHIVSNSTLCQQSWARLTVLHGLACRHTVIGVNTKLVGRTNCSSKVSDAA